MDERRASLEADTPIRFVATPMQLPLNRDLSSQTFAKLARIYNEGMAELQTKNDDLIWAAVAAVPLDDIDNAVTEAKYAIEQLGMKGILLPCNFRGEEPASPRLKPLLKFMAQYDLPIWLHPWPAATSRQFVPNSGGWEMLADTADAMLHLACSGIFEEEPNIKFVAHHGGSYIPFFHTRLKSQYFWDMGSKGPMYAPDFEEADHTVPFIYYENLKKFYVDTAFYGICTPQIQACISYFGVDHVLFGTDYPLPSGRELPLAIKSMEQLSLSSGDKDAIYERNVAKLLHLEI